MKRGLLLFAFAALSLSTSGAAQTLDQAISDLRAGAYESAIEALGEISRSDPGPNLTGAIDGERMWRISPPWPRSGDTRMRSKP